MRTMKWNRCLGALAAMVLGVCATVTVAGAAEYDVTTEQAGSIIVFPKVIWDGAGPGSRDTLIEISNASFMPAMAHCFYIDGEACDETDFYIFLTKQQPTSWLASTGRSASSSSGGFAPGRVPPVPPGFRGQLMCVQVGTDDLEPLRADQLRGEAVLRDSEGDVSKYNAIAFRGNEATDVIESANPYELNLNWSNASDANRRGQYSSCPAELRVGHASGTAGEFKYSAATTEFTLVPCAADLENQTFLKTKVKFYVINEYEQQLSLDTISVGCWLNISLASLVSIDSIGTPGVQTRIEMVQESGVVGVVEEYRVPGIRAATGLESGHAASAMIGLGSHNTPAVDRFVLPQP